MEARLCHNSGGCWSSMYLSSASKIWHIFNDGQQVLKESFSSGHIASREWDGHRCGTQWAQTCQMACGVSTTSACLGKPHSRDEGLMGECRRFCSQCASRCLYTTFFFSLVELTTWLAKKKKKPWEHIAGQAGAEGMSINNKIFFKTEHSWRDNASSDRF